MMFSSQKDKDRERWRSHRAARSPDKIVSDTALHTERTCSQRVRARAATRAETADLSPVSRKRREKQLAGDAAAKRQRRADLDSNARFAANEADRKRKADSRSNRTPEQKQSDQVADRNRKRDARLPTSSGFRKQREKKDGKKLLDFCKFPLDDFVRFA